MNKTKHLVFLILLIGSIPAKSQILISLLLGDKLNSDKLEFGLDGGVSLTNYIGHEKSEFLSTFNLGFYFDFKLGQSKWKINTGVRVKSNMGATNGPVYSLNDATLDSIFRDGEVTRRLGYFYVPVLLKYTFDNQIYLEGGAQVGLNHKASDTFLKSISDPNDLSLEVEVRDHFKRLDAGITGGIGYRLLGGNGMNLGIRGYLGLVNVNKTLTPAVMQNYGWYFNVGVPIGKTTAPKN